FFCFFAVSPFGVMLGVMLHAEDTWTPTIVAQSRRATPAGGLGLRNYVCAACAMATVVESHRQESSTLRLELHRVKTKQSKKILQCVMQA
ncbi:hypothetical protein EDC01DRAFT_655764, partial [Geopyxis carbonaria]